VAPSKAYGCARALRATGTTEKDPLQEGVPRSGNHVQALSPAVLSRLGVALAASKEDWRGVAAVRLLLFTGARLSEVLSLKWAYIDTERGLARLPDSKTGAKKFVPTGSGLGHPRRSASFGRVTLRFARRSGR
jgi:integrase